MQLQDLLRRNRAAVANAMQRPQHAHSLSCTGAGSSVASSVYPPSPVSDRSRSPLVSGGSHMGHERRPISGSGHRGRSSSVYGNISARPLATSRKEPSEGRRESATTVRDTLRMQSRRVPARSFSPHAAGGYRHPHVPCEALLQTMPAAYSPSPARFSHMSDSEASPSDSGRSGSVASDYDSDYVSVKPSDLVSSLSSPRSSFYNLTSSGGRSFVPRTPVAFREVYNNMGRYEEEVECDAAEARISEFENELSYMEESTSGQSCQVPGTVHRASNALFELAESQLPQPRHKDFKAGTAPDSPSPAPTRQSNPEEPEPSTPVGRAYRGGSHTLSLVCPVSIGDRVSATASKTIAAMGPGVLISTGAADSEACDACIPSNVDLATADSAGHSSGDQPTTGVCDASPSVPPCAADSALEQPSQVNSRAAESEETATPPAIVQQQPSSGSDDQELTASCYVELKKCEPDDTSAQQAPADATDAKDSSAGNIFMPPDDFSASFMPEREEAILEVVTSTSPTSHTTTCPSIAENSASDPFEVGYCTSPLYLQKLHALIYPDSSSLHSESETSPHTEAARCTASGAEQHHDAREEEPELQTKTSDVSATEKSCSCLLYTSPSPRD